MIRAPQPIGFTAATSKVRHNAVPSGFGGVGHETSRVVTLLIAFQAMEQDNKSVALRVIDPVEVDKIMIRRFPTLAPIGKGITSRQPTCINGLQVPAGEPPRRPIRSR